MPARYFLDTNVFVYCFDGGIGANRRAESLVGQALDDHVGIITQVVQEFNVSTTKFARPMNRNESRAYLDAVLPPV